MVFPGSTAVWLFVGAAVTLLVVPGPAVLYVVVQSAERGPRTGLASVLGVHVGTLVHVAAAAAGLSALLVASATAFSTVKFAGAAYLVYLGVRRIVARESADGVDAAPRSPASSSSVSALLAPWLSDANGQARARRLRARDGRRDRAARRDSAPSGWPG